MVNIPTYQRGAPGGAVASFDGPLAAPPPRNYDRLRQALDSWQGQLQQRAEERAASFQQQQAESAQSELGTSGVASPDPGIAPRFQAEFQRRARSVYSEQLKTAAVDQQRTLMREHAFDPQGFAAAWQEYVEGTVSAAKQSDPEAATGARRYLEHTGVQGYQQLAQNAWSQEQQRQETETSRRFLDRLSAVQSLMLDDPNEATYHEHLQELEADLLDHVDANVLPPQVADRLIAQARKQTTDGFVWGRFEQSIAAGDIGGAQGVIASMWAGQYYDDLGQAQTAARQMQARLGQATATDTGLHAQAIRRLREAERTMRRGGAIDLSAYQEDIQMGLSGTADQRADTQQLVTSIAVTQNAAPLVDALPEPHLLQLREEVLADPHALPGEGQNHLLTLIDDRVAQIRTARVNRDYAAVVKQPGQQGALTPEQQQQAVHIFGVRPQDVFPHDREAIGRMGKQLSDAAQAGDVATFNAAATEFYAGMPMNQQIAATTRLGSMSGNAYLPLMTMHIGHPELSNEWLVATSTGAGLDSAEIKGFRLGQGDIDTYFRRAGVMDQVNALGFGNATLRQNIESAALDAYKFYLNQFDGNRREADRALRRLFEPFEVETVGQNPVPVALLGDTPAARAASRGLIEEMFGTLEADPAALGLSHMRQQQAVLPHLRLMPDTSGDGWNLWNPFRGTLVATDDRETFVFRPGEDSTFQARSSEAAQPGTFQSTLESVERGINQSLDFARNSFEGAAITRAASQAGTSPDLMGSIAEAMRQTPGADLAGRVGPMRLPPEIQARYGRDALSQFPYPAHVRPESNEASYPAAAQYLRHLEQKYGDQQQVLAAYWMGEEALDHLLSETDAWMSSLPLEVYQFVSRVSYRGNLRQMPEDVLGAP